LSPEPERVATNGDLPVQELERLRAGLRIMALRALGSADAAEEVVQETLSRIVVVLREKRARPNNLAAFTCGIARHVIADAIRARARTTTVDSGVEEIPSGGSDPLAALLSSEEKTRVQSAMARIPPADREILHLAFFDGLRSREIAARLGEPGERVRKRKQRALERLRQAFLAEGRHETMRSATYQEGR